MKTIYVVTSGEYSDYGIDSIFDTKELAEKYIASFNKGGWNEMDIEEWCLNPNEEELKEGKKAYRIRMDKEGNATEIEWADSAFGFKDEMGDGVSFTYNNKLMNCYCFAKDDKHAVKIANERRVQYLAANSWGKRM